MKVEVIGTGRVGLVTAATSESALGVPVIVSDVRPRRGARPRRSPVVPVGEIRQLALRSPSSWVRAVRLRATDAANELRSTLDWSRTAEQQLLYRGVTCL
jgi:hypothetical protein